MRIQDPGTGVTCHKCQEEEGQVSPMGSGGIGSFSLQSWVKGWGGVEVLEVGGVEGGVKGGEGQERSKGI